MNGYQEKRILEALDNEELLTEWEWDFINSLADMCHNKDPSKNRELTEKQNHILNRISQKIR